MLTFSELKKGLFETRWTRFAVIAIIVQCVLVIVFESITYVNHRIETGLIKTYSAMEPANQPNSQLALDTGRAYRNAMSLSVYHILFMVAQIFTVFAQFDAIMAKNTMQLIAVTFFEFCMTIYSVVQYHQAAVLLDTPQLQGILADFMPGTYHKSAWSEIVVIVIMVLFSLMHAALSWRLFQDFGWSIYKKIGADLAMRDMFRWYQVFLMILKFDVFFFLGFSIQYLVILKTESDSNNQSQFAEQLAVHIMLSLLVTMAMLVLAFWGVVSERTPVMILFMVCGIGSLVYFIITVVNVNRYGDSPTSPFVGAQIFLTFFLAVCIALIVVTLIVSYFCLRNFGKGLKLHVKHESQELSDTVQLSGVNSDGQYLHREAKDKRWSIE